jgi:AraC-like DNA-binding protein
MLSLKEMADFSGLSVSHYSFIFKKKTGFPPLEYFNHLKIQLACQYLLFSEMKIKDIGEMLGINDPYYFSRSFRRIMGVSPKFYRESRINQ